MRTRAEIQQTLCRMCDDRCGIDVHLEDGRIVDILGNKDHPWNRGRLCVKARAAVDMVYHPDRLLAPLKRTDGGWQEIPLEQALDEIAARLAAIKERLGARSISVWKGEAIGFGQQEDHRPPLRPRPRQPQLPVQRLHVLRGALHRLQAGRRGVARPRPRERPLHRPVGSQPALRASQHDAVHHGARGARARRSWSSTRASRRSPGAPTSTPTCAPAPTAPSPGG